MHVTAARRLFRDVMYVVQWEYRFEIVGLASHEARDASHVLDELGAQGWEAVGFSPAEATSHGLRTVQTTTYVVLLKRPLAHTP